MTFEVKDYILDVQNNLNKLNTLSSHKQAILDIVRESALMHRMELLSLDNLHEIIQKVRKKLDYVEGDDQIIGALAEILNASSIINLSDKFFQQEFIDHIATNSEVPLSTILKNILNKLRVNDFSRSLLDVLCKDGKNEAFSQSFMGRLIGPMLMPLATDFTVQLSGRTVSGPAQSLFTHPKKRHNIANFVQQYNGTTAETNFDYSNGTSRTLASIVETLYYQQLAFLSENTHLVPNAMKYTATSLYNMLSKIKRLDDLDKKDPISIAFTTSETKGQPKYADVSRLRVALVGSILNIALLNYAAIGYIETITPQNVRDAILNEISSDALQEEFNRFKQHNSNEILEQLGIKKGQSNEKAKQYISDNLKNFGELFFSQPEIAGKYPTIVGYIGQCTINNNFDEQLREDLSLLIEKKLIDNSYQGKLKNPRDIVEKLKTFLQTMLNENSDAKLTYPAIAGYLSDWSSYIQNNFLLFKKQVYFLKKILEAGPLQLCVDTVNNLEASNDASTTLNASKSRSPTIYQRGDDKDKIVLRTGKEEEGETQENADEPEKSVTTEETKITRKDELISALKEMAKTKYNNGIFQLYAKICMQDLDALKDDMSANAKIPIYLRKKDFFASLDKPVIAGDHLKRIFTALRDKLPYYYGLNLSYLNKPEVTIQSKVHILLTMLPYLGLIKKDSIKGSIDKLFDGLLRSAQDMVEKEPESKLLPSLLGCLIYYSKAIQAHKMSQLILDLCHKYQDKTKINVTGQFSADPIAFERSQHWPVINLFDKYVYSVEYGLAKRLIQSKESLKPDTASPETPRINKN